MKLPSFLSKQDVAVTGFKGSGAATSDKADYNAADHLVRSLPDTGGKQNELEKIAALARMTP